MVNDDFVLQQRDIVLWNLHRIVKVFLNLRWKIPKVKGLILQKCDYSEFHLNSR